MWEVPPDINYNLWFKVLQLDFSLSHRGKVWMSSFILGIQLCEGLDDSKVSTLPH